LAQLELHLAIPSDYLLTRLSNGATGLPEALDSGARGEELQRKDVVWEKSDTRKDAADGAWKC
jgi:hypothetical protein